MTAAGRAATSADLRVRVTVPDRSARAGHNVDYRIRVTNRGPSAARSLRLTIGLPVGPIAFSSLPGRPACSSPGPGPSPIVCRRAALAPGATWLLRVGIRADRPRQFRVTARIRAATPDPKPGNNRAAAAVGVLRMP